MCVEILLGDKSIKVRETFKADSMILIQNKKPSLAATTILGKVYWDGWIKKEDVPKWTNKAWTKAEIFATKFNQRGRWYDVPPGQIIEGIILSTSEKTILKIVTREAIGKEINVQERFAQTGRRILVQRN